MQATKPVFISYGDKASMSVALHLRDLILSLPFRRIDPWVAEPDIQTGRRWGLELAKQLDRAELGILCMTMQNRRNPWIAFEAGALTKHLEEAQVTPYLIDLGPEDLEEPIKQFQAVRSDEHGTLKLIMQLHQLDEGTNTPERNMLNAFKLAWPVFLKKLDSSRRTISKGHPEVSDRPEEKLDNGTFVLRANVLLDSILHKVNTMFIQSPVYSESIHDISDRLLALEIMELLSEGNSYLEHNPAKALMTYASALAKDPGNEQAIICIAKARFRLDEVEVAIDLLNDVLRRNKKSGRAYYNRACYRANSGAKYKQADVFSDLEHAMSLEPAYAKYAAKDKDLQRYWKIPRFLRLFRTVEAGKN